jgi:K(+)-stimulated pyrophosphate-energized sodium pump
VLIGSVMIWYFGFLSHAEGEAAQVPTALRVLIILGFSLVGIAGSFGVAWFGIRVNTFANSRAAFASLGASLSRPTTFPSRRACRSA